MNQAIDSQTITKQSQVSERAADLMTVRRDLDFFEQGIENKYWFDNDPVKTRLFDALQIVFPVGEKYFIRCVRLYQDQITDQKLKAEVKSFIGQEAEHGKQHRKYNDMLRAQGMPIDDLEAAFEKRINYVFDNRPPEVNIANTAAIEHLTAMMAKIMFNRKATMANIDPEIRAIWAWHSIEEMEHRAVCYDVMKDIAKVDEKTRVRAMKLASKIVPIFTFKRAFYLLRADGFSRLQTLKMLRQGYKWLTGENGLFSEIKEDFNAWYNEGFHPDDIPVIHNYSAWIAEYEKSQDPMLASNALWQAGH